MWLLVAKSMGMIGPFPQLANCSGASSQSGASDAQPTRCGRVWYVTAWPSARKTGSPIVLFLTIDSYVCRYWKRGGCPATRLFLALPSKPQVPYQTSARRPCTSLIMFSSAKQFLPNLLNARINRPIAEAAVDVIPLEAARDAP